MTIPEIVKKYTIRVNPNKSLCVRREILKHEDDKVYIMEHRDEIIAYIEEQKAIEEQKHLERLKKINAIEGSNGFIQTSRKQHCSSSAGKLVCKNNSVKEVFL